MTFNQGRRRRVYELNMKPYPGLVVRVRKPSFAALDRLTSALPVLGDDLEGTSVPALARIKAWGQLYRAFAECLVDWTLTDGEPARPVPATVAGVLAQDPEFLLELARTWYYVVVLADPDAGEPEADDDGEPVVDEEWLAQLPMMPVPPAATSEPEPEVAA